MPDHDPLAYLEPEQLLSDRSRPLPRARLDRRASAGLWALRVWVVLLSAIVIYTFISQLAS